MHAYICQTQKTKQNKCKDIDKKNNKSINARDKNKIHSNASFFFLLINYNCLHAVRCRL